MDNPEDEAYSIRITSHGKIKNWVSFALTSFQENPDMPLTFHTIPPKTKTPQEQGIDKDKDKSKKTQTRATASKLASSISLAPRLITVVEIVKREFLKSLAEKRSPRLRGLHQYNEIGILEDEGVAAEETIEEGKGKAVAVDAGQERSTRIIEALSGKNHVRQVQTPYIRTTLSLIELPSLQAKGATYQPPSSRRLTKSAKARARKREKKQEEINPTATAEGEEAGDAMEMS